MVANRHGRKWRAQPQGFALAFLAVAIQLLLPFMIAFEIAAASTPAYAETASLCLAAGSTGAPASHDRKTGHHGVAGGCPICVTLAASQAFTAPAPIAAPPPPERPITLFSTSPSSLSLVPAPAFYRSRAPPFIV